MNLYDGMKARQQRAVDQYLNSYAFFAFSESQFNESLKKLGADPAQLRTLPGGGFILADRTVGLMELLQANAQEREAALKNPQFAYDMFFSELGNHEYSYTGSTAETLDALGLDPDRIRADPVLSDALDRAKRDALRG